MNEIRTTLDERLTAKGLEKNEVKLFIKDVLRIMSRSPESNLEAMKGELLLLGWREDYTDNGTIELIQACYQDG